MKTNNEPLVHFIKLAKLCDIFAKGANKAADFIEHEVGLAKNSRHPPLMDRSLTESVATYSHFQKDTYKKLKPDCRFKSISHIDLSPGSKDLLIEVLWCSLSQERKTSLATQIFPQKRRPSGKKDH